ncbi:hypothetical protein VP01_30g3 [Puccinia sorghi]|uniref:Uncharacterized protein n=1 Tax=Puccinia sorghi TaxID=27349 RepID=A0A0L6V1A5_9BASI|nr:hypothetical protein VP01_30g3 [Puccinia sorghi]
MYSNRWFRRGCWRMRLRAIANSDVLLRRFRLQKRSRETRVRAVLFCGGECQPPASSDGSRGRQEGAACPNIDRPKGLVNGYKRAKEAESHPCPLNSGPEELIVLGLLRRELSGRSEKPSPLHYCFRQGLKLVIGSGHLIFLLIPLGLRPSGRSPEYISSTYYKVGLRRPSAFSIQGSVTSETSPDIWGPHREIVFLIPVFLLLGTHPISSKWFCTSHGVVGTTTHLKNIYIYIYISTFSSVYSANNVGFRKGV